MPQVFKIGSYIDVVVFGGENFKKSNIFAFAEELRETLGKNADVFEISEVAVLIPREFWFDSKCHCSSFSKFWQARRLVRLPYSQ